jgi:tetratricopeptide (TPR) repeat protein
MRAATLMMAALLCLGACGGSATKAPVNQARDAARERNIAASRELANGQPARAIALYRASLTGAEAIEDFDLAAANLANLALAHARLGQWREAHEAADRVIAAPERYGPAATALAHARKAWVHLDEGAPDEALRQADLAERGCTAPCAYAAALANLRAQVALSRGAHDDALRHATRAIELAGTGRPAGESVAERATGLRLLGRAHSLAGRHGDAAYALDRALTMDKELGASAAIALDLVYAGDNEARRGDARRSREFHERALAVYAASDDQRGVELVRARLSGR